MSRFTIRVGMVLFWKSWFWEVDRKLIDSWRLRKLAENAYHVLPTWAFFEALQSNALMIVSEYPGNPLAKADIATLQALAAQLKSQWANDPCLLEPSARSISFCDLNGYPGHQQYPENPNPYAITNRRKTL